MLALFKGELSYTEFMREMTYKEMRALRDIRVKQILDERKEAENAASDRERENIRNTIMSI